MLLQCKLPEDDLRKIEVFLILRGLCVIVCILIRVHLSVLSIELFIYARISILLRISIVKAG